MFSDDGGGSMYILPYVYMACVCVCVCTGSKFIWLKYAKLQSISKRYVIHLL